MDYAGKYELRGYDAVQLAAANEVEIEFRNIGAPSLIFVSADNDLNAAAQAEGFLIDNPNHRP